MKLIIINGPTGVGKSTVSKLLHEQMPMSFLLNIDEVRRSLSLYAKHREASGELSHAISQSIIRTVFENGRDVILEKCMIHPEVIDAYRAIADEFSADIHEYMLWAPKQLVLERAGNRGWHEGGLLTREKCEELWEKIDAFKDQRPQAKLIDVTGFTPDEVLKKMREDDL
jgi:predicted kinase